MILTVSFQKLLVSYFEKTLISRVKAQNASLREKYDDLDARYEVLARKDKDGLT